ncbi:hypothetical protein FDUTEX481_09631 [Tolypothrix sp. PCC 7601]|nr:hypothetical protein FDUTEX481_09631 [Tolypothrix sp. PCC 7601]
MSLGMGHWAWGMGHGVLVFLYAPLLRLLPLLPLLPHLPHPNDSVQLAH